jgi:peroxiredoxin
MVVDNGVVEHWLEEPGRKDNNGPDPFSVSSAESVLAALKG